MPQLDVITLVTQIVCLFVFYFYLYLKFLKNVVGTTIAVLTVRKYYLYQQYAYAMVHIFKNKSIKKQLGTVFIKYFNLFSKTALLKYGYIQHLLEESNEESHEESDVSDITDINNIK